MLNEEESTSLIGSSINLSKIQKKKKSVGKEIMNGYSNSAEIFMEAFLCYLNCIKCSDNKI